MNLTPQVVFKRYIPPNKNHSVVELRQTTKDVDPAVHYSSEQHSTYLGETDDPPIFGTILPLFFDKMFIFARYT